MLLPKPPKTVLSGLSLLLSVSIAAPAIAQIGASRPFPGAPQPAPGPAQPIIVQAGPVTIPAGTTLPVRYDEAERILVTPEETVPLTLQVAANIRDRNGRILIPFGSEIVGQIQPAERGSQFVAQEIVINGQRQFLQADSAVVTRTEEVRDGVSTGNILEGAAIGGAAAAVLAEVTGGIDALEVLGGAGLGALGGFLLNRGDTEELVVIEPDNDLAVTLSAPLVVVP